MIQENKASKYMLYAIGERVLVVIGILIALTINNWNDAMPTFAPWYDYSKYPEMAKKALACCPVSYIQNWKAPVLMIHGDDNRNVPFSESVNFAELLRKQNVPLELLVFPDEVHDFLLYKNWLKAYEATYEFINRQLNLNNIQK